MTGRTRATAYLLGCVAAGIVAVAMGLTALTPAAGVAVGVLVAVVGGVWVARAVPVLDRSVRRRRSYRTGARERGEDGT